MMVTDILVGFLILTLFVYVLIMCMNKKFNKTECMLIGTALVLLLTVYIVYMVKVKHMDKVSEGFEAALLDYNIGCAKGAPLNYKIGPFSGLNVTSNDLPYNNLTPQELISQNKVIYHSPVGTPHSLKPDPYVNCNLPSVDGTLDAPKAMAMLAYNRSSPDCCPSTYSNSIGCVCLSENQKAYLRRGGSVIGANNKIISGNASNDL